MGRPFRADDRENNWAGNWEQMERLAHRSKYVTRPILQSVVKLLALLSVLPWDVMVEFLQQLRVGKVDRDQWPATMQDAMSDTDYFDKLKYQAVYWYLIEQIAERLKTGELRNAAIYEFNPDVLYEPGRKKTSASKHTATKAPIPPAGIPPPLK